MFLRLYFSTYFRQASLKGRAQNSSSVPMKKNDVLGNRSDIPVSSNCLPVNSTVVPMNNIYVLVGGGSIGIPVNSAYVPVHSSVSLNSSCVPLIVHPCIRVV